MLTSVIRELYYYMYAYLHMYIVPLYHLRYTWIFTSLLLERYKNVYDNFLIIRETHACLEQESICYFLVLIFFMSPRLRVGGHINLPLSVCSSVQIQIHGLSGYLLHFWSYSFNILQDVHTHNGGVHVHRILIFFKYSQNDRQLDLVIFQLTWPQAM